MPETEEVRPRTYDSTLRFWVIFVVASIVGIVIALTVVFPWLDNAFETEGSQMQTVAKDYGAQEVSWGRYGLMYVKIEGKSLTCGQLSDTELADRKPIRCSDGTVIPVVDR